MKGTSYTYFTTDNSKSARELISILREAKAHVPPQLEEMAMYSGGGGRSACRLVYPVHFLIEFLIKVVMEVAADEVAAAVEAHGMEVGATITMVMVMKGTGGECGWHSFCLH